MHNEKQVFSTHYSEQLHSSATADDDAALHTLTARAIAQPWQAPRPSATADIADRENTNGGVLTMPRAW